jgi:hypothetical protein
MCGGKKDYAFVNANFRVKKRWRDLTQTYDGYLIASGRMRQFLIANGCNDNDFINLPSEKGFWWLKPGALIKVHGRETSRCVECGHALDLVGPWIEETDTPECWKNVIVASESEFGSVPLKSRYVMVQRGLKELLAAQKFKGVSFWRITTCAPKGDV